MAVIEMQKEPRSIKAVLFVAALVVGFVALGGVIFWLVKPAAPRQVKLTGALAKEATASAAPRPAAALPPQPPIPPAKDPGPTPITLELKQVTPRQAIAEVATKAKVNLNLANVAQQGFLAAIMSERTDVSWVNEPFWSAMLDLCRKGKLVPYADWQQPNRISFQQGQALGPSVAVGSCAIVLDAVTSRFDANLTGPRAPQRSLTVSMKLFVEPKLKAYRIAGVATLEAAVDEKGNNLVQPRGQWDDRNGGGPQSNWTRDVTCNLLFPDTAGDRIARLKGYASVAVADAEKTEKIADPVGKANVDLKFDDQLVRLVEVRKTGSDYVVRMVGSADSPVFRDYEKMQKIVALVDANGKEFQRTGGSYGGGRPGTFEFGVHFSGDAMSEAKELRITMPTGLKELRVPFEFTDLPLPH